MKKNTFRPRRLALLGGLLLATGHAVAGSLYVIANSEIGLSETDLKEVYLGEKQFAGSLRLVPIDNAVAQSEFLRRAIAIDATKYSTAWVKKGFREGLNPPSLKSSDLEVIEYVKRTPGAIGYVTAAPSAGVVLILKY